MAVNIIWPPAGAYILAVSGGADSMVLLDLFARVARERDYQLTVAHFDHGLRLDSGQDRQFVEAAAARYHLPFAVQRAQLAAGASEATARNARHAWLEATRRHHHAAAILTAHHADDLIETSLLNLARGSGRLGLAPMSDTATLRRPLIRIMRAQLRAYAAAHDITWREDSTNADLANPRNFLRLRLLPAAPPTWHSRYQDLITQFTTLNTKIDQSINDILDHHHRDTTTYSFPKELIKSLNQAEIIELLLAGARRLRPGIQLDRRLLVEAAAFVQRGQPHKFRPLRQGLMLSQAKTSVDLTTKSLH